MIPQSEWKWFGYPLHYTLGTRCIFHLGTVVGDYLVSTVEKQTPFGWNGDSSNCEPLGYASNAEPLYFETCVFKWTPRQTCACPQIDFNSFSGDAEIERHVYGGIDDCDLANKEHYDTCLRYAGLNETSELV